MKSNLIASSFAVFALTAAPFSSAGVINIDFNHATSPTYVGTAVAPDTGTVWNGFANGSENNTPLVDSFGETTIVTITKGDWAVFNNDEGGSIDALMSDYLHNGNNPSFLGTVTFNGLIAGESYDLYLYGMGDIPFSYTDFALDAANGGASGSTTGPGRSPFASPDNYVVLTGTADGSGSLSYTWSTGTPRGAGDPNWAVHNGAQLVGVIPEPGSLALLGLGGVLVLRRRRG